MKYLTILLFLLSSSVFAQGYGYYPQQQYQQIDRYQQMEQQTQRSEVDQTRPERRRNRSTFPGW